LVSLPEALSKDFISNAELLRQLKRPDWTASLEKAKLAAEDRPTDASRIVNWYRLNGEPEVGLTWAEKLDPSVTDSPEVRSARGECLVRLQQWERLSAPDEDRNWGPQEFQRLAYLSRAQKETGDDLASTGSWTSAVRACWGDRGR
jgi:hypothetical protein